MGQLFNEVIFDEIVEGTAEVFTSSQFDYLLGQADELMFQVRALDSSGSSPTLRTIHYHCNDGRNWTSKQTLTATIDISTTPTDNMAQSGGSYGSLGRVGVKLGGTTPVAHIRIIASGFVN